MIEKAATAIISSDGVTFEEASALGILLWAVNRFDKAADGTFMNTRSDGKLISVDVYREFQSEVRAAVKKLESQTR